LKKFFIIDINIKNNYFYFIYKIKNIFNVLLKFIIIHMDIFRRLY